jgi:ABC-type multidrug transport system permease subunit
MNRFFAVIKKSLREQMRSFWILLLTLITAPFFVIIYNLISQSYTTEYDVIILNLDGQIYDNQIPVRLGDSLITFMQAKENQGWKFKMAGTREQAVHMLKNKEADLLMVIPGNFTASLEKAKFNARNKIQTKTFDLEFLGNKTDIKYIIAAILTYDAVNDFVTGYTGMGPLFTFTETPLGNSGQLTEFERAVPGLIIFAIIMLMLTASVAMVAEVENKTMIRLKLSGVRTWELMGGITVIQVIVGMISVLITLAAAASLGFRFHGSLIPVLLVLILTMISVIAFSLFIAAFSKTVAQVLIIGNFPLFIFMFFTGAMFPMESHPWFIAGGYPISLTSLMSPTHAVRALNKLLIMRGGIADIIPELVCLTALSVLYVVSGMWVYRRRHMKL